MLIFFGSKDKMVVIAVFVISQNSKCEVGAHFCLLQVKKLFSVQCVDYTAIELDEIGESNSQAPPIAATPTGLGQYCLSVRGGKRRSRRGENKEKGEWGRGK